MAMSKQDFLINAGLLPQTLEAWLEWEWVTPAQTSAGQAFSEGDVARAHLIQSLQVDFGVNDEGLDLILHLIDQLHGMRRALDQLRSEVA